ncbi:hypothetical protein Syn7803C97_80 [Synechococcus phage S-MbCM6]|uniref:Gp7 baseplate wedge initiator n=3 Tax=Namakavirus smbcm6 TaxID=2734120 RepID=H8ZMI7_9CAUD|nr:baseplate wedge subunit [Synechococcus phage ACG-2014c]AHB80716.1 baseplate wedge initiator [Synechococcus phage S-MbCM25]AFD02698.1 gp7 baseplate wedge initiator [Synechococcus phage ACG-2014c]AIX14475.1 hypothetical protein Syn7803C43_80 [Synechococcus phage ACG-2014c]AIX22633.1 hypothetical protein Syn7803C97_80 [Synechococcus phage ACG-2014c]AIX22848.1 hypothetical protein Syn7803C98_80 [Synechococcus phage ACG-2014c]
MAREIPGSGAVIEPVFNEVYGIKAVTVINGGDGYTSSDPPRLTITGCGTPVEAAVLYPIIDDDAGRIIHVRVLESGSGYDPIRVSILPSQDTPDVVNSFNPNRIWQSTPNSQTVSNFQIVENEVVDRLRIESDNNPKPALLAGIREFGNTLLTDNTYDHTIIYRAGKDVPDSGTRAFQSNKTLGIFANGTLLHTPDWGGVGGAPVNFNIDTVKHKHIKSHNEFDGVIDNSNYFYHTNKLIGQFAQKNSVFENGFIRPYTWTIKVEYGNVAIDVTSIDESIAPFEVGRQIDVITNETYAKVAKIVRDGSNNITRLYLREVNGTFANGDLLLGNTGFKCTISDDPVTLNIYYIEFGPNAQEFGPFTPGEYYPIPDNITVKRNSLIIWNQSDSSNAEGIGHPIQFSTTADGALNTGTLYYDSTGASGAPSVDYENEYQTLFLMNEDETNRIYYYCKNHRYMSGYEGDEGYMILDPANDSDPLPNNYYIGSNFLSNGLPDYSRHADGHSKIIGVAYDGYPIYGPFGYTSGRTAGLMTSSYRLKVGNEVTAGRPQQNTEGQVTYTVTVSNNKFLFNGQELDLLNLERGKEYIFNQDDSSNDGEHLFFSTTEDGWHVGSPPVIGDLDYLFSAGMRYFIDGSEVTYAVYLSAFTGATTRELRYSVLVDAPRLLYAFAYSTSGLGLRSVQDGYIMGDFVQDYIYEEGLGNLDAHNGKFAVTPEYPNGTYAYFMAEDNQQNPVYPYVVGPTFYGSPLFVDDEVPEVTQDFPSGALAEPVLNDSGAVEYVKMIRSGDGYFGPANVRILGGSGSGATASPVVQSVTGLTLLNEGTQYATSPSLIFEGGGGQGARGAAEVSTTGKITRIDVIDSGEFYQEAPYILINGGGGGGAKAVARIDQGSIVGIDVVDPGSKFTSVPSVLFTKLVNLRRKVSARQSLNSSNLYISGLLKKAEASDTTIYVSNTSAFPGSGDALLQNETISYTGKTTNSFTGVTRGVTFKYDQRVVLDTNLDNDAGTSQYKFNVGDRVIRRVESSTNKVAKVYDWNPNLKELLVTFEVDELAFIDGGIPTTEDAIVQFDAGIPTSSASGANPHTLVASDGNTITLLTVPISTLTGLDFEDDDELEGVGNGIPDLVNTGSQYENQINLDGGIAVSLYGIEETVGGQNTTLFQVGDSIKDATLPFNYATVVTAGQLSEGIPHDALINMTLGTGNGQNFSTGEIITGSESGIQATVVAWNPTDKILQVNNVVPYNTGDANIGEGGLLYKFSTNSTIVDFIVADQGINYSSVPSISVENIGDIGVVATPVMTVAGDQIESVTITTGGYGYVQTVEANVLHPTTTVTNAVGDTTGEDAVLQAVLGAEKITGQNGASFTISRIDYNTQVRSSS